MDFQSEPGPYEPKYVLSFPFFCSHLLLLYVVYQPSKLFKESKLAFCKATGLAEVLVGVTNDVVTFNFIPIRT